MHDAQADSDKLKSIFSIFEGIKYLSRVLALRQTIYIGYFGDFIEVVNILRVGLVALFLLNGFIKKSFHPKKSNQDIINDIRV